MKQQITTKQVVFSFPKDEELSDRLKKFQEIVFQPVQDEKTYGYSSFLYRKLVQELLPEEYDSIQGTWSKFVLEPTEETASPLKNAIACAISRADTGHPPIPYLRTIKAKQKRVYGR